MARLMAALVQAAPEAVRRLKGRGSAAEKFPEFRAWHALLQPLFEIAPPDWTEKQPPQRMLAFAEERAGYETQGGDDEPEEDDEE